MITEILVVLKKELVDASRDRRSLVSASTYALWAPGAIAIALPAMARDRPADQPIDLVVSGAAHAPSLIAYLTQQPTVRLSDVEGDPYEAVRSQRSVVAVAVSPDYPAHFTASKTASV